MIPTPEQIAKLPKWAQEYIRTVEYDRDQWKEAAELRSDPDSNVLYDQRAGQMFGLPRNARVRFVLGSRPMEEYIDVRHEEPHGMGRQSARWITVRAGAAQLAVVPCSANLLAVRLGE